MLSHIGKFSINKAFKTKNLISCFLNYHKANSLVKKNSCFFSTAKNYEELKKELNFETDEDKDLRYEDQLFFLEREMDKLIRDKIEYGQDYATSDLPEYQERELNSLIEIIKNFDFVEKEYFYIRLKEYLDKACDSRLHKQNSFLMDKNIKLKNDTTKFNPNNEILDSILLPLGPYLASDLFMGGGGAAVATPVAAKAEEKKEEKKDTKPQEVKY